MMSKTKLTFTLIATLLVLGGFFIYRSRNSEASNLDEFAKCLSEKNITMYGAEWCPHCQNEKKAFGSSFQYVNYVECPDNPNLCVEKGVKGYPTWIFPDGKKLQGEQGITKLSRESGCELPDKSD